MIEGTLMGTIKVPRNLTQITDRLPVAQYNSRMNRNVSLPMMPELVSNNLIAKSNLAVINETREEVLRSADLRRTRSNDAAAKELLGGRN